MGHETYARFFTLQEESKESLHENWPEPKVWQIQSLDSWLKEAIIYWRESNLSLKVKRRVAS